MKLSFNIFVIKVPVAIFVSTTNTYTYVKNCYEGCFFWRHSWQNINIRSSKGKFVIFLKDGHLYLAFKSTTQTRLLKMWKGFMVLIL